MPREARKKSKSGIYHVMMRGVNKQKIFEDDHDRVRFLNTLKKYKTTCNFNLYSYCLMGNHVHLLMKENDESISEAIKKISSSYVYWYNMKYDRFGHLFQGRFKSEVVEDNGYFLTVLRYIHQNPLKAGLTNNVSNSKWTSYHEYLKKSDFIDRDYGLNLISSNRNEAIKLYKIYMGELNDDQCLDEIIRIKLTDHEVRERIKKIGKTNSSALQQMDRENRNAILIKLKRINGVSIRQLSRITGISKSVIDRLD